MVTTHGRHFDLGDRPLADHFSGAVHRIDYIARFRLRQIFKGEGNFGLCLRVGFIHQENGLSGAHGDASPASGALFPIQNGQVGNRIPDLNRAKRTGIFTGVAGNLLYALNDRHGALFHALLAGNAGSASQFLGAGNAGKTYTFGHIQTRSFL